MNHFTSKIIALCAAIISVTAYAGYREVTEVTIGDRYAQGVLSAARNSADSKQYIGCQLDSFGGGSCAAGDNAGHYFYCYTSDPKFVDAIQTISAQSFVYVYRSSSSQCAYLSVTNESKYIY